MADVLGLVEVVDLGSWIGCNLNEDIGLVIDELCVLGLRERLVACNVNEPI